MTEQQIDLRERELDYWMTRAYEAEGKLWKAEARIAEEKHLRMKATAAATQAEADRDWNLRSSRLAKEERIKANARADQAEARIKAVEDVLDRWQVDGYDALLRRIRRALDGDA